MSQRVAIVIEKLYRIRRAVVRHVFALARREAEKLPPLGWVAVISITTPGRPPAALLGFEHVLRISFEDVNMLNPGERVKDARVASAFTGEQALQVRDFVLGLPASITALVLHCEGGYSRSCAIARALHDELGYVAELDRLADANPSVVALIKKALS